MALPPVRRMAPAAFLVAGALITGIALSENTHDGFHPLVIMACMLPVQLSALWWSLGRAKQQ